METRVRVVSQQNPAFLLSLLITSPGYLPHLIMLRTCGPALPTYLRHPNLSSLMKTAISFLNGVWPFCFYMDFIKIGPNQFQSEIGKLSITLIISSARPGWPSVTLHNRILAIYFFGKFSHTHLGSLHSSKNMTFQSPQHLRSLLTSTLDLSDAFEKFII